MAPTDAGTDGTEDTEGDGVETAWRNEPLTEGRVTEAMLGSKGYQQSLQRTE